jgi:hypothetical protein
MIFFHKSVEKKTFSLYIFFLLFQNFIILLKIQSGYFFCDNFDNSGAKFDGICILLCNNKSKNHYLFDMHLTQKVLQIIE